MRILDRDYRLACEPAERDRLLAAAAHVDRQMHAIREQGRVAGIERIAVFAALNIAGALLSGPATAEALDPQSERRADTSRDGLQTAVADPEILRRMQDIDALLDTAFATAAANQERLF